MTASPFFKISRCAVFTIAMGLCLQLHSASAATFYIDYASGDDARSGTSAEQSWKHCPGDDQAGERAAQTKLAPGDSVVFKGGVEYPGALNLKWSGAAGNPITIDGNSVGSFGTGRAVFNGAQKLTGWKRCASREEAGGANDWASCWTVNVSGPIDAWGANLIFDGHERGGVARFPNAPDMFWWQNLKGFADIADGDISPTWARLHDAMAAPLGENWQDSFIGVWQLDNHIALRPIESVSDDGKTLSFPVNAPRKSANRFALFNHPRLLDVRGEYSVVDGGKRIIFFNGPGAAAPEIEISARPYGIHLNKQSHIVIRGLRLQNYAGAYGDNRAGAGIITWPDGANESVGITISDCEVINNQSLSRVAALQLMGIEDLRVENCRIADNQGSPGVLLSNCKRVVVRGNTFDRNGGTGVRMFGSHDALVENNRVTRHLGMHANGITIYLESRDVIVRGNRVEGGLIPFTLQSSQNVTAEYNVFVTTEEAGPGVAIWPPSKGLGSMQNVTLRNNVMLGARDNGLIVNDAKATGLRVYNNIIGGSMLALTDAEEMSHNLYTARAWKQNKADWQWEPNAIQVKKGDPVFVDEAAGNFQLRAGSPAIDAGKDWKASGDFLGKPINGNAPDLGAFEFQG